MSDGFVMISQKRYFFLSGTNLLFFQQRIVTYRKEVH